MSLFDSLNNTGIANGNAMVEQFESTFSGYTEELKQTGNKYSLLTEADFDDNIIFEDFLTIDPLFGEVLELDDDEKNEHLRAWLDEARGQTLEENIADLANTEAEFEQTMEAGDPDDEFAMYAAMVTVLKYVIEEQTTGVSLPKVSDPVE